MKIFDYDDIQLIPNKCIVKKRSQCDTSIIFGNRKFKIPIVPANMKSIIDKKLAIWLAKNEYFYIMHRFDSFNKRLNFINELNKLGLFSSISIGVSDLEFKFVNYLVKKKIFPDYITIDIAHGHSILSLKMIKFIKKNIKKVFLIVGNVTTPEAVRELENAGADATKVGIGPGKVCITKSKTGFGSYGWQLSAIHWCAKAARKPLIADGGIKNNGDIAKSIRFGASICMLGSLLAGHNESPSKLIKKKNLFYKEYYGSASIFQKKKEKNIEGKKILILKKGSIKKTLKEIKEDLQSSISYSGGKDLESIKKVNYTIVRRQYNIK